ncbi:MAG: hypothetical protein B6U68_02415 [Candidatus Aenigmarchaeota archaeon ex4484_14]|nr:MAG: hypothetical protein B6U68_02415 [Candidatus Aenigmarchaeota archaeon ex4484_14]
MLDFVKKLDADGILVKIDRPVSVEYEMASIIKKLQDRPILFTKPVLKSGEHSKYPVIANLCPTRQLLCKALDIDEKNLLFKVSDAINNPSKPTIVKENYEEIDTDLSRLPILTHFEKDGGPYMSASVVIANDPKYGINCSFHRMMVIGKDKLAARILPRHFSQYIDRGLKEFAICIGMEPNVLLASAISVGAGQSELEISNTLKMTKTVDINGHVVPCSDIVMIAELTGETHDEGPFVDLTETYDIVRKQPVIKIKKIFIRKDAVYHTILPSGLEHKILMGVPKEPVIFNEVNKVCRCKNVYITPGGCSWLHAVVAIKNTKADDGKQAIEAAFRGHKSLKHVIVVDEDINIFDPNEIEWAIATRFQADKDLVIKKNERGSSLDPSADPKTRKTTKLGMDCTIPFDKDAQHFVKVKAPLEDKISIRDYVEIID